MRMRGASWLWREAAGLLERAPRTFTSALHCPASGMHYYKALESAEREVAARRAALGPKLTDVGELRRFVEWASQQRNRIARQWRIPAGPGGVLGGEIRDWRQYGAGGRTLDNLLARAEKRQGLTGEAALLKVLGSTDKPNPAVTEAILRGSRYLRNAGSVMFIGGAASMAYQVSQAPASQRMEVLLREGSAFAGGAVAGNLAIGVCFLLGVGGIPLLAVGLVAGLAGAFVAERIYFAHRGSPALQGFLSGQPQQLGNFMFQPLL